MMHQTTATRVEMPFCWFRRTRICFLSFFTTVDFFQHFHTFYTSTFGEYWFTTRVKANVVKLPFARMLPSATPQLTTRMWTGARGF